MEKYGSLSDLELLELVKSGDADAFTAIYDQYWTKLYLHVYRIVKDQDLAQDLVQELFITLYEKREELQINSSLSGFLYKTVRNKVFDAIKRNKIKESYLSEITSLSRDIVYHADEQFRFNELSKLIDEEIDSMPAKMRQIFNLSRKSHLTHRQIAELLNISEHTVSTQIQRALKLLRKNENLKCSIIMMSLKQLM